MNEFYSHKQHSYREIMYKQINIIYKHMCVNEHNLARRTDFHIYDFYESTKVF